VWLLSVQVAWLVPLAAEEDAAPESVPERYVLEYPTAKAFYTPTVTTFSDANRRFVKRGVTQHPNGGYGKVMMQAGGRGIRHLGADISWYRVNAPVYSIAAGVVRLSMPPMRERLKAAGVTLKGRSIMDWGNAIVIEHKLSEDETIVAVYAHLSKARRVHPGDVVCAGQQIGNIGRKSALVNGGYEPHLHLGIRDSALMKQGVGIFSVPIEGKPTLVRLDEIGEETISVAVPEGTPDVWGVTLRGVPITVRKTEGRYSMPAWVLWGVAPRETAIVGYGPTTDGWVDPLGLLQQRRAASGTKGRLNPSWHVREEDEPLANATGKQAPSWNVSEWLRPLPGGVSDVGDLSGKVVCLVCVQASCRGSRSHALPSIARLAGHYAESPDVQLVVLQTAFKKSRRNSQALLQKIADELPPNIPVGDFDPEALPAPIVDDYALRGTPWTVLIDAAGRVRLSGTHVRTDACIELIDALRKEREAGPDNPKDDG
jgi:murein DD-endopeptidase MepM/ murein hydrolase activator NlpD